MAHTCVSKHNDTASCLHLSITTLDQHPNIPAVQELDLRGDVISASLIGAVEQCGLEAEDRLLLLAVNLGPDGDQTIRVPQPGLEGGPATADGDLAALVLHDLEVV